MIEELTTELLAAGFVALIHRRSEIVNKPKNVDNYPELSGLFHQDYQQFVERFASHGEEN